VQDNFDCEVWRPLLRWSEQDVIEIYHRHELRMRGPELPSPRSAWWPR